MLQISKISKQFGPKILFHEATVEIKPGERIGLIGPNGTGKTTLLNMICGSIEPDEGNIVFPKQAKIGFLKQDVSIDGSSHLLDEVMKGFPEIARLERQLIDCEIKLALEPENQQLLHEYGKLREAFEQRDGYKIESKAKAILFGVGFNNEDFNKTMRQFSGGWMMRIALARLLLQQPEILLLDEPTNHLDLESILWLEKFIIEYPGIVILISHDQYFLNRTVTKIIEIDQQKLFAYPGNYNEYELAKTQRLELLEAQIKTQQKELAKTERFIERFRYKASKAKQVQSRVKQLDRVERLELPEEFRKEMRLNLPTPKRAGKIIAELTKIKKYYGENVVYNSLNFMITNGQKIGLVGPNGAGKSTLLKILAQVIDFQSGSLEFGHHVESYYYAQHQLDILNAENTILQELSLAAPELSEQKIRSLAGMFLFSADEVFKQISVLSGGEKARVALAKMLANPANFLVLDEPTNHLDIHSRRILQEALSNFEGTLIFISHDREFINGVAKSIVEVKSGKLTEFLGDYDYYLWKKEQQVTTLSKQEPESKSTNLSSTSSNKKQDRVLRAQFQQEKQKRIGPMQKQVNQLEQEIATAEDTKTHLTELLCQQKIIEDSDLLTQKTKELNQVNVNLEQRYQEWERLNETIEAETEKLKREFDIDG